MKVGDNGNEERFASLNVRITVDRDREDPKFDRDIYYVTISETTSIGDLIETVRATDADLRQFPVRRCTTFSQYLSHGYILLISSSERP